MLPTDVMADLTGRQNVLGAGRAAGRDQKLIVFVEERQPISMLSDADIVPERLSLDDGEYETDVYATGQVWAQGRQGQMRPVPGGVSGGHPAITTGTVGFELFRRNSDGTPVLATNTHVAAPPTDGDGNELDVGVGDPFLQPGTHDGGEEDDKIGELVSWAEIKKDEPNRDDTALVEVDPTLVKDNELFELGQLAGLETAATDPGEQVKSGRTTGVTSGELLATDVTINVRGYYPNTAAEFVEVDALTPMSSGGDSGSLICERREDGLWGQRWLFAGGPQATFAIPMENSFETHGRFRVAFPEMGGGGGGGGGDGGDLWRRVLRWLRGIWS